MWLWLFKLKINHLQNTFYILYTNSIIIKKLVFKKKCQKIYRPFVIKNLLVYPPKNCFANCNWKSFDSVEHNYMIFSFKQLCCIYAFLVGKEGQWPTAPPNLILKL